MRKIMEWVKFSIPALEPVIRWLTRQFVPRRTDMAGILLRFAVPRDDVIKWKHFPRYWPFMRGIHRSPVNSTHKGQWRGALMFSFICARINGWVNNRGAGDLRRHCAHYDVIVIHLWTGEIMHRKVLRKYFTGGGGVISVNGFPS